MVSVTILEAWFMLTEAQLECEVPGECIGQFVGFVEENDITRYTNLVTVACACFSFLTSLYKPMGLVTKQKQAHNIYAHTDALC